MIEIYRQALGFYRSAFLALLGLAALMEGLVWLLEPEQPKLLQMAPLIILAYLFHRHFLFGETIGFKAQPGAKPFKFGWFLLLSLALIFVPVGFGIWGMIRAMNTGTSKYLAISYMPLISLPLYLLALSLFGTALPALVDRNPQYRLMAGLRASPRTLGYLLVAPVPVGAALFAALIALGASPLGTSPLLLSPLGQLAISIAIQTLGFLPTILAVAVLCHVYRLITPPPAA